MKQTILLLVIIFLFVKCERENEENMYHHVSVHTLDMGLPFSDAVIYNDLIFLSGNLGNIPGQMKLVPGGIKSETKQTMQNIQSILEANGATIDDIIKCTIMMADISEWSVFNEEYVKFFPGKKPARSAFGTTGLALGARVEIECIAKEP